MRTRRRSLILRAVRTPARTALLAVAVAVPAAAAQAPPVEAQAPVGVSETVVLLHGLGRTSRSMRPLAEALRGEGYRVVNVGYPSREHRIVVLVDTLEATLRDCCPAPTRVHFVTHSLGGILVRAWAAREGADRIGRVVMLSPPNDGSEVVDRLGEVGPLDRLLGPAFMQLGTDSASVPLALGPPGFELGIITGDASLNPLFSWWIPGPDDGKVGVESARLEGAEGFLVVPYSHAFIMRRGEVIAQVLAFLGRGQFLDRSERDGVDRR